MIKTIGLQLWRLRSRQYRSRFAQEDIVNEWMSRSVWKQRKENVNGLRRLWAKVNEVQNIESLVICERALWARLHHSSAVRPIVHYRRICASLAIVGTHLACFLMRIRKYSLGRSATGAFRSCIDIISKILHNCYFLDCESGNHWFRICLRNDTFSQL